jgi:hypothetical protein
MTMFGFWRAMVRFVSSLLVANRNDDVRCA